MSRSSYTICEASPIFSGIELFRVSKRSTRLFFALKKFRHCLASNRFKLCTDNQALKHVLNMKDLHGRIARWFTLLQEYDFEICYQAGHDNACADFLSRSVKLMVIDENQSFKSNLEAIAHYLKNLSVVDESILITAEMKKKAKDFLVHDERLFRRTKYGILFAPHKEMQESILKRLHDEVAHWDFYSKYSFARDCFRCPSIRKEFTSFLKSCDTYQETKQVNRKELAGRIPISGLFHKWCIDFAGPLPRTNVGNQCLVVAVEQMSNWPVAWTIPADLYNSLGAMEFVKKKIIILFGPSQYILSDRCLKFDCKAVKDFGHRFNIQCKCTSTYNPQSNGVVGQMVGTLKRRYKKSLGANPRSGRHSLRM